MNQNVFDAIKKKGDEYGLPVTTWYPVVMTESGGNPACMGDGGTSYGLFQIHVPAHPDFDTSRYQDINYICDYWMPELKRVYDIALRKGLTGADIPVYVERYGERPVWTSAVENNVRSYYSVIADGNQATTDSNTSSDSNSEDSAPQPIPYEARIPIEGSEKRYDALFGRRYRIVVSDNNENGTDISDLRITFKVVKACTRDIIYNIVEVYNLNPQTESDIIKNGSRIILEAGYEGEQYGCVFDGNIVQAFRRREQTEYVLTIISLDGDRLLNSGLVNLSIQRGQTQRDLLNSIASQSTVAVKLGSISENLSQSRLTRGKVFFGLAKDYLEQLAASNNANFYMDNGSINIIKVTDPPNDEVIDIGPDSGLVNNVQQTEQGINFQCLLNPRIKPDAFVKVKSSLIIERQIEMGTLPTRLDEYGVYRVIKATYIGDTRGNDWYVEVEALSQAGYVVNLVQNASQSTN